MAEDTAPATPPGEPLPFRLLIDEAMKGTRRWFRRLYLPIALPAAVVQTGAIVFYVGWLQRLGLTGTGAVDPEDLGLGTGCGVILLVLGASAFTWFCHLVLFAAAVDAAAGRPVSLRASWRRLLRPRGLGTVLLAVVIVVVGLLACILPGIFLYLLLALVIPVMVHEDLAGTRALGRSRVLTLYRPPGRPLQITLLKVLVLVFLGWVLQLALSSLVQGPFTVAQQVLTFRDVMGGAGEAGAAPLRYLWLTVPAQLLTSFAATAVRLYLAFAMALLYLDVLRRREGRDLEEAVEALLRGRPEIGGRGSAPGAPLGSSGAPAADLPPPPGSRREDRS